ncbi:MAG: hypothetical protein NTW78_05830 [Campylobacterales bacterium]|nr:hypothetical protein [Campylobacterales bacterium]
MDEIKQEQEYRQTVENYTNQEIINILNFDYKIPIYNVIFKIAAYTGMRQKEIYNLTTKDIINENDIYYFNVTNSKTVAGIRKIPIHKDILELVLNTNFPLMPGTENAFSKNARVQLYKIIDKGAGKNFHTLRGTFIEKTIEKNIDSVNIVLMVQQIVGHTKNEKESLTLDRYAKGFNLKILKDIIDNVSYY